ncbi:MAG TPA: glutaminyl-peptide cyclotransferase [Pyrinomonadaceae bacterium]|nr:glutaminyl-peptide cyclotransferase [Pyrinomonadaceae bacterium]
MRFSFVFVLLLLSFSCGNPGPVPNNNASTPNVNKTAVPVVMYDYEIVKTYPHDPKAFTQGLEFHDGVLYEGTGGKNDDFFSSLRKTDFSTGKVLQKHDLGNEYFGEGITILNEKIYQLTWKEMTAFEYDLKDFKLLRELRYSGEGWGLTNDGTNLIMSDGTHVIRFVNPQDFKTVRTIVVNDEKGKPVMELNELEFVKGEIWANIWRTGWIVRIDPATGKLLGRIDMNKLADEEQQKNEHADVLNGIAYDAAGDRLFVTGKLWSRLFEIKVNPR